MERVLDFILSGLAVIVLSPLLVLIACILKASGEGEILYIQPRVGKNGSLFGLLKFATMLKDSPNIGSGLHTIKKDPRVLPMGHFLRKTKINELPQLFNILLGSMSIIGPRPLVDKTFEPYSDLVKNNIYKVKPGLSGIGSIVFRDEEKILTDSEMSPHECYRNIILPYKGELEIWYQDHCSLFLDFQLIFLTAWAIFFPKSLIHEKWYKDLPKQSF